MERRAPTSACAPFGVEAQRILRLEKGHVIVGQDTDGLTQGFSAGLDGLIKLDKDDFVGKPELALAARDEEQARGWSPCSTARRAPSCPRRPARSSKASGIAGRVTSSRMSPTLGRAGLPGPARGAARRPSATEVTVRLPDGRDSTPGHADLRPRRPGRRSASVSGPARAQPDPAACTAIVLAAGRSARARAAGALTLTDCTPLAKVLLRAPARRPGRRRARRAARRALAGTRTGVLVVGLGTGGVARCSPAPGQAADVVARLDDLAGRSPARPSASPISPTAAP